MSEFLKRDFLKVERKCTADYGELSMCLFFEKREREGCYCKFNMDGSCYRPNDKSPEKVEVSPAVVKLIVSVEENRFRGCLNKP